MCSVARTGCATSTTGCLRWCGGLVVAATVVLAIGLATVVYGAHTTVNTMAERTGPATTAVQVARASLAEANREVVDSFRSGTARLAGPGQRYQDGITRASHALAELGEHYAGSLAATQDLQFVNAMLVTYLGLVAQADAAHRLAGATDADYDLGLIYLWHASKLLYDPDGGILALIDRLGEPVQDQLTNQRQDWRLRPMAVIAAGLAAIPLLLLLVAAQFFLLRRFRRVVNLPLALATAALLGLGAWATAVTTHTNQQYRDGMAAHEQVNRQWRLEAQVAHADAQESLTELLLVPCQDQPDCQRAVADALASTRAGPQLDPAAWSAVESTSPATQVDFVDAVQAAAESSRPLRVGAPGLLLGIGALALLGLALRLREYRS